MTEENKQLNKSMTRKIIISDETKQKALMLASKYHPDSMFDKKPDEVLALIFGEAIEYMYQQKLITEIKNEE